MSITISVEPRGAAFAIVVEGLNRVDADAIALAVRYATSPGQCICGTPFPPSRTGHRRYCSDRCRARVGKQRERDRARVVTERTAQHARIFGT